MKILIFQIYLIMVKKRQNLTCNWLSDKISGSLKSVDIYGEPVTFSYDSDYKNITTITGGLLTIIIGITVFIYLY